MGRYEFYKTLCVLMGPFRSFVVLMRLYEALWFCMGPNRSICVLVASNWCLLSL